MKQSYRTKVYADASGEFRWRIVAHNGNIVADSSESYTRRGDATRALRQFIDTVKAGRIDSDEE